MWNRLLRHFSLAFYVWLFMLFFLAFYLKDAPTATGLAWVYTLSIAGYFSFFLLVPTVLMAPLALLKVTARWVVLPAWLWLVFVMADLAVFHLYKFHIDGLLIEMFFKDFHGVGVPWPILLAAAVVAVGLLWLVNWLYKLTGTQARWSITLAGWCVGLLLFGVNTVTNIWATHYNRDEITQYRAYPPIYWPVEFDAKAEAISQWWPDVFPAKEGKGEFTLDRATQLVDYPLTAPQCKKQATPPSILMIVLESWQADAMNAAVTPFIHRFAKGTTQFKQHYSSGSTTIPGLFGLLYGVHASYHGYFKASPDSYPSQFTETLYKQNYDMRVYTSSNLDGFALKNLFFSRVKPEHYHDIEDDTVLVNRWVADLQSRPAGQPRFDFLFLTASHSPYRYPKEFAKFQPVPLVQGGFAINTQADATMYLNKYYNSLHYEDHLVRQLITALEKRPEYQNTWIVVTGDHAEEFNENGLGYWGHGSNFSRWQVQTPMLVKAPRQTQGEVQARMSTHQDVVPTLMKKALNCQSATGDYSHGADLFDLPEKRPAVMASYKSTAYLIDGVVMDKLNRKKYDINDMKVERPLEDTSKIKALMADEHRFLHAQ